jgi:hypothetical protein
MLLGGRAGGPFIRLAEDIASAPDEKDQLRILPLASDGALGNIRDVLLLRGVDLGITSVQALNIAKASGELGPNLEKRIAYIAPLTVGPFHALVRSDIKSVKDLHGRKVNIAQKGSGTSNYSLQILKVLGIEIVPVNASVQEGMELLNNKEIDANFCVCPWPVPAFLAAKPELGFRFLEIPYVEPLEEAFLPGILTNDHYPNLIPPGTSVRTVANTTVLITYNWPPGSERFRKIERFVHVFFSKIEKLRQRPPPAIWKDVNISASIRGWQRFPAAQQWLDRQNAELAAKAKAKAPPAVNPTLAREQAAKAAPHDAGEQERLFNEFLEWSRKQKRR